MRTVASVNAPSIPPVDVRPNFAASLGVAPGRRTNLPSTSLPAVVGNQRQHVTVSIIYEDSDRTISFITAPSVHLSDSDSDRSVNVDLERGPDECDIGESLNPFDDGHGPYMEDRYEDTEHSHMSLPSGLYDIESSPIHRTSTPATSHSVDDHHSAEGREDQHSILETISRHSRTSDVTAVAVETAIHQRWLQGLSFASFTERRGLKGEHHRSITSARVLFWLGFIAPWCWLIGGWYLSRSGEVKAEGQYPETVKWKWPRRSRAKSVVKPSKEAKSKRTLSPFWRSHARTQETMPMSPVDHHSVHTVRSLVEEKGDARLVNPWVKRCRIAAAISGILLCAGVIVCIVILAGVRG